MRNMIYRPGFASIALAAAAGTGSAAKGNTSPTPPAPPSTETPKPGRNTAAATAAPRVAAEITAIRTDIPMPTVRSNRGSKPLFDLDKLLVGQSIGVKNKTAKQLASNVSNANKRFIVQKKDANGQPIEIKDELKDAAGNTIGYNSRNPQEFETEATRKFFVMDVDPATDPDQAKARIWREK